MMQIVLPPDANLRRRGIYGPYAAGDGNATHEHNRGHISVRISGSFDVFAVIDEVWLQNAIGLSAENPEIYIRKGVPHRFVAREDGSRFVCYWGAPEAEDGDGQILNGWPNRYE